MCILNLFKRHKYNLADVFTPSTAAVLTYVNRPDVYKQIDKALMIPGMQLILYGHSGSGKTTIIQNALQSKNIKFISTNCMIDTTVADIILDAFDKLNPFYTTESTSKTSEKISSELKASYSSVESAIKSELVAENGEKKQRALPIQLTPQRLAEFLGASKVVWIIEDFHKVKEEERKKLSQILKVFVDTANKYKEVKIIAIGAVGTARDVVNYDSELANRVSEIFVPLLNTEELEEIVKKGEKLLNVDFCNEIHSNIVKYSNSLAAICHHLCFSVCYNNKIEKTQKTKKKLDNKNLQDAVADYLKQNSDSFKEILDRALKYRDGNFDETKFILKAFCQQNKDELTLKEVNLYGGNKKRFGNDNVKKYLTFLTTAEYGEILRFDANSGKYYFSNPFFKAFAIMMFTLEEKNNQQANRPIPIEIFNAQVYELLGKLYLREIENNVKKLNK